MEIKKLYETVINNSITIDTFYKLLILESIKGELADEFVRVLPQFEKIVIKLIEEHIITRANGQIHLNRINYDDSEYKMLLEGKKGASMKFPVFKAKFFDEWKGKFGKYKGTRYSLLDRGKAEMELLTFIEENRDIELETILKANKEFIEDLEIDSSGCLLYAPKCSTFIKGNDKNEYLIEYCNNIVDRRGAQMKIKNIGEDPYEGFGQSI